MKQRLVLLVILACGLIPALAAPAGAQSPDSNITEGCVESYDPDANYFPEQVTVEYAENFTVEYFNNYKVVTIPTPWAGAAPVQYVLVQCGTPAPEDVGDATVFEVPATTIVTLSTSYLPMLDKLGLVDNIVGHDVFAYISTESVRERIDAGKMVELGEGAGINVELVLDLEPSLIMTYSFGDPTYDAYPALIEAGLPVVFNGDFMETTPLGRAEWIKYIALYYNVEGDAQAIFDEIATRYEDMAALAAGVKDKPTVFTDSPFQGTWYVPGGNSFTARLLADAGSEYVFSDDESTGALYLDFETVFERAADAEFWVNASGYWASLDDALATDERFAEFAAFENGNVWANNLRVNESGGNDYYEGGVANPDLVLADLIAIFHPDLMPDHTFTYYQLLQ
jgi:iron complex transport system substrate-binding protein